MDEQNRNLKAVIEASLFVSESPLTPEQLKPVLGGTDAAAIRALVLEMNTEYEQQARGVRIVEVAGGYRMVTPSSLHPFLKKLYREKKVERFSKPALETLAIIAYKQPVTRLEIESIRSVKNVDDMVRTLVEKDFIKVVGEKQAPGRPKVYGTTKLFLEYFGLKSLEDLPRMEDFAKLEEQKLKELQAAGITEVPPQETVQEPTNDTQNSAQ